jgi:hypothetical protein
LAKQAAGGRACAGRLPREGAAPGSDGVYHGGRPTAPGPSPVTQRSDPLVVLTIADLTRKKSVTHTAACSTCQRSSAEWIIERPAECSNSSCTKAFLTELADFHHSTMTGQAQVAGQHVKGIGGFVNTQIFMVDTLKSGGFISLDDISGVAKSAFTATWLRSGHTVPIQL